MKKYILYLSLLIVSFSNTLKPASSLATPTLIEAYSWQPQNDLSYQSPNLQTSQSYTPLNFQSTDYLLNQIKKVQETKYTSNDLSNQSPRILKVPKVNQLPTYPNGCEAASTTMLLNYYNINISLKEFIENYLPIKKVYRFDDVIYGPDPSKYFAGNPSETFSYSCFESVIKKALTKMQKTYKFQILELSQKPLNQLINYLPVVIWTTLDYRENKTLKTWYSYDGKTTFSYSPNSHTVILIGYDDDYYYIADPLKEEPITKVSKKHLTASYDSMGRQAISLIK